MRRTMNAQQSRRFVAACQDLQRLAVNPTIVALLRALAGLP